MAKCVFCGKEQEDSKGMYLLKNDGSVNYFCSSKCRKNKLKLKRDNRKKRWTEAFHVSREKRLSKEKERIEKARAEKAEEKAKKTDKAEAEKKSVKKSESKKSSKKSGKK